MPQQGISTSSRTGVCRLLDLLRALWPCHSYHEDLPHLSIFAPSTRRNMRANHIRYGLSSQCGPRTLDFGEFPIVFQALVVGRFLSVQL